MRFLIFLVYLTGEIFLIAQFIDEWGFLAFVGEVILSALLGFGVLSAQFGAVGANLRSIMRSHISVGAFVGKSIFRALGGILLILPFILSDILGVCFVVLSLFFRTKNAESGFDSKTDSAEFYHFNVDSADFKGAESSRNFAESSKFKAEQGDIIEAEIIEHKSLK